MNSVFWFLIVVGLFVLWLLLSVIFIPLGKFIIKKYKKLNKIFDYDDDMDKR